MIPISPKSSFQTAPKVKVSKLKCLCVKTTEVGFIENLLEFISFDIDLQTNVWKLNIGVRVSHSRYIPQISKLAVFTFYIQLLIHYFKEIDIYSSPHANEACRVDL